MSNRTEHLRELLLKFKKPLSSEIDKRRIHLRISLLLECSAMTHDLIVVGGGPAGASCARRAAQRGLDVVIIEKAVHPRRKACGGGFRPGLLDLLDFDATSALDRETCGCHLFSPSRTKVVATKDMITGYLVRREVFDKLLFDKAAEAGAEIVSGTEVVDVTESAEEVIAHQADGNNIKGKFLVGADGVNSKVARKSGLKPRWKDEEIGLCIEARVPMDESEIVRITKGPYNRDLYCIQIYFGDIEHGYAWCFPKKGEVSLGMGCLMPFAAGLKRAWTNFTAEFSKLYDVKIDLSEETAMRVPLKEPANRTVTKRILLAGDAGGFVSAATGEGMCYAIETGQIAAEIVNNIIQGQIRDTTEYERRWKKTIGKQLKVSKFLANLLFNSEKNMELAIQMAAQDEVMRGYMTDLIGGLRPYSELRTALMKRVLTRHPLSGVKMLT
jgi:geranylgeranyl reductase family protein